jgi:thiol-disulfide isomerase/thioredoxin
MKELLITIFLIWSSLTAFAQLPDIEVMDIDQNPISLSELNGEKLTVIDFWATWCKPCVTAIRKLNSIYEELGPLGIQFVGVNVDGPRNQSKVKPFAKSLNIKYPIVLDPDQDLVNEFHVTAFPTLIVLNKKGKKVFIHEGFNPGDEKLIQKELSKILKNEAAN